jgi:hypothetical protein
MASQSAEELTTITRVIGSISYRMAQASGWIGQPFVSRFNPSPPGAMLVVSPIACIQYDNMTGIRTRFIKTPVIEFAGVFVIKN